MHVLLGRNREVIFSASPDARSCIQVVSRDRQDSPYIKAWSGDPVEVTRITREAVSLCAPRMTLLWLPQTDVVREMFSRRVLARNGFLPRVLPCVIESLRKQSSYVTALQANKSHITFGIRKFVFIMIAPILEQF